MVGRLELGCPDNECQQTLSAAVAESVVSVGQGVGLVVDLETNEEVDLIVWEETDLGYNVIVNNLYKGLVYRSDIYKPLSTGDRMRGYVKQVRPDQKLDITLQQPGYAHVEPNARKILEMLRSGQGFLPFTDKSAPEDIADHFQMSKKTFKKALGALYRQRLVRLEDDGIYLV